MAKKKSDWVEMPVADLAPNPKNPRQISDQNLGHLRGSLDRFGLVENLVWNRKTKRLVSGHQRVKVLQQLGQETAMVRVVSLGKRDEATLMVELNNPAAQGEFTDDLADLFEEFGEFEGFDDLGLDDLFELPKPEVIQDEPPPPPKRPRTKPGDLLVMGRHRLLCGDSTDPDVVAAVMAGELASLVVTDPPYGVAYQNDGDPIHLKKRRRRTDLLVVENDNLGDEGTRKLVCAAAVAWPLTPGGAFYVFSPPGRTETVFRLALDDAKHELRQCLVWAKDRFVMGRQDYQWRHESILYGWRDGAAHYFVDDRTQDTVWECPRPSKSEDHPTMKPVELVARAIANSSRPDDVVFDGFAGSGTLLVACHQTGRVARLVELDPRYCDVIAARWLALTGDPPVVERGKKRATWKPPA